MRVGWSLSVWASLTFAFPALAGDLREAVIRIGGGARRWAWGWGWRPRARVPLPYLVGSGCGGGGGVRPILALWWACNWGGHGGFFKRVQFGSVGCHCGFDGRAQDGLEGGHHSVHPCQGWGRGRRRGFCNP